MMGNVLRSTIPDHQPPVRHLRQLYVVRYDHGKPATRVFVGTVPPML